ncbi:Histidine kinase [Lutibacter agarilyticus]|uniref:Histidine kinase n=1 Tax=Lutibacter agarilyticus TaxID=1109740 RepID=A0A238WD85_9FLAO|nr:histidine kinase [Lutibacter agarilyticus]SNR44321.1 Histidine kinase [Lutibacter agarilyticus]
MKSKWFKNTSYSIPTKNHVWFWLGYFAFNVIRWGSYFDDYWYSLKSNLVEFPLHIILVYFNIYFLLPKYILRKKYKTYIVIFILSLFVIYILRTELNYFLVTKNIWPEAETVQEAFTFNHIVAVILGEVYVVALATAIKLIFDWTYERRRVENLEQIQLRTELNFLKSQIQPHFFFNTLNNLYALTLVKSDAAPSVVLKLSDIMQYVLYDVKEPKIRLFTAINYIQNYLDLERLRYGDNIQSTTDIIGNIEDIEVPPLLFLPFIENCFKHGTKDNSTIEVFISFENIEDKWLIFKVENTFNELALLKETNKKHGIGIKNVKRRLELLFKNNFEFHNTIKEQKYCIQLKIPIE